MKKTLIILLASFYLVLASGLTLSLHYCGGKLKEVSLFSTNEDGCCGKKMKSKDCCKHKTAFIKVKESHSLGKEVQLNSVYPHLIAVVSSQLHPFSRINEIYVIPNYHSPPVLYDNPLYLRYRVLII